MTGNVKTNHRLEFNVMLTKKLDGFSSLIINLPCHVYDRLCCLSNVVVMMTKTLTGYVLLYVKVS